MSGNREQLYLTILLMIGPPERPYTVGGRTTLEWITAFDAAWAQMNDSKSSTGNEFNLFWAWWRAHANKHDHGEYRWNP